jgi:anti-anti-sigma regulatory factor
MTEYGDGRTTLAMSFDLGGRHAASARVELLEQPGDSRVARVALRGRMDRTAERRLERALVDLAPRGVSRVVLDCSDVRRLDGRQAERLVAAMSRFEASSGPIDVCGLSAALRDRLGARARCWPPEEEPATPVLASHGERRA